jgi:hypothetical protein
MQKDHESRFGSDNRRCKVTLRQGIARPGGNITVQEPHCDILFEQYPFLKTESDSELYIVSDVPELTTIFYQQSFLLPETLNLKSWYWTDRAKSLDIDRQLTQIFKDQLDPGRAYMPPAYQISRIGPYNVHEARQASESTFRTFMHVSFSRDR